jgi:hypothetical protein
VLPSNQQRTLAIDFFDLGDSSLGAAEGTLQVTTRGVSPSYSPSPCRFVPPPVTGDPVSRTLPFPLSDFQEDANCTLRYNANGASGQPNWNGRWVTFHLSLPPANSPNGYNCDTTVATNCWIQLKITPDFGALSDATTWRAQLQGLPVRLVG